MSIPRRAVDVDPPAPGVAARMRRQARKDTTPEVVVRRRLHAMGLRYRVHVPVPGLRRRTIDVCFPRARVAVFIDGCYWHGCADHKGTATHNAAWWAAKIEANRKRDAETTAALEGAGWTVLRVWEHDVVRDSGQAVADLVARAARRTDE